MDHGAIGRVLEVNFDSVADADAEERPRHLPIKGPVPECRAFSETSLELDREQIDAHGLRRPIADRWGNITRFVGNIGLGHGLRRRARGDEELAFHAGKLVARHAAEIQEVASARGAEGDTRAGAAPDDAGRLCFLFGEDDIVFGAFAVDERDLHDLTFSSGENGVDLTLDGSADAQVHHAPFGNPGTKRITHVWNVADRSTIASAWRDLLLLS